MANYVKVGEFGAVNTRDALWYVMTEADLATLVANESVVFGDKAYCITTKKVFIRGNDGQWYQM